MRPFYYITLTLLLLCAGTTYAQKTPVIYLRSGIVQLLPFTQASVDSFNKKAIRMNNRSYVLLQFKHIPTQDDIKLLSNGGISLSQYIPDLTYTASLLGKLDAALLQRAGVYGFMEPKPETKMDPRLASGRLPIWSVKVTGTVDVLISIPKNILVGEVLELLKAKNMQVVSMVWKDYHLITVRAAANRLYELASYPFIESVQAVPPADHTLNYISRSNSGAGLLNVSVANGGKALNGDSLVIGIGDDADPYNHIDFKNRLIDRTYYSFSAHGIHTAGTMAGAGNVNELYRGYASKASFVSQIFSGIINYASKYVQDYGMVLTNNSYGFSADCTEFGVYDPYSQVLDQQAFDLPYLAHVFAAGNSGTQNCTPYSSGYHTVYGGYQAAKNVIVVGSMNDSFVISSFSSRGPVKDGRVKPDIIAVGESIISTVGSNLYGSNQGTSMAAPAVTGGAALLYQRYKQLHSGSNPKSGLIKAILCNGASDKGNTGPDYKYGYGALNLSRSVQMIDNGNYFTGTSTQGANNTQTINVPLNTAQLKIVLYWHDPAASLISSKTLVNDLDLEVVDPSNNVVYPYLLDTANANLGNAGTTGADHLNNLEQIVIVNPASGTYTIRVKGTTIAQNGSQEFFVVYDPIPVSIKVMNPTGGAGRLPGESIKISWDPQGDSASTFALDYTTDNGANWTSIATGLSASRRVYTWTIPSVPTSQARVRVTKELTGAYNSSDTFTILGQPTVSLASIQCESYISLTWTSVSGATDYEVMMLKGDSMSTVATTSSTNYIISGLQRDSIYWVTVRPRINGVAGRRALAISRTPTAATCAGTISDNDLSLAAIVLPAASARKYTSSQLGSATTIQVIVKNLDDAAASSYVVKYSINGGAWVTETPGVTVSALGIMYYSFTTKADLSAVGTYAITAVVKNNATDPVASNDTCTTVIKHLDNQPISLASAYTESFESALSWYYSKDTVGLSGIDRFDYSRVATNINNARLRTFVNSGFARTGSKAITLDVDHYNPAGSSNYLTGTFNLSNYNAASNDVRLDFAYLNHGQAASNVNKVWIRGSETQTWIEVYDLHANQEDPGTYKQTSSIAVSRFLTSNSQNFSTSFQVKWGTFAEFAAADPLEAAGYTFDDVRLYEAVNDMQMISIDSPTVASCGLSAASTIKVTVFNSSYNTLNNVPVKYQVNGGTWVSETISSIAANTSTTYTFTTTANLSANGSYIIKALVDYATDNYRDNDTLCVTVINNPVISSFPYLQDFESGSGYWYSGGKNSSWEYGTPASVKIRGAASGSGAWKTRLAGNYNDYEQSYLYSPCFNVSGMTNPTLSFSVAIDLEDCGNNSLCDGAWVEYSTDGVNWTKLGTYNTGTNWYNSSSFGLWSKQDYTQWHVATVALPTGSSKLRIRFVMSSDPATNKEGIAIDDIHIYDNSNHIYNDGPLSGPITQNVSGNSWIDFTSNGKLIASLYPNSQNLGSTAVQVYIDTTASRWTNDQYYSARNITIKPTNRFPSDSVTVRFYFRDREAELLLNATGCNTCYKPTSAYNLGISKFSGAGAANEDSTVANNTTGIWTFIPVSQRKLVPYDSGYYAEFKVLTFSEFWLNNGGLSSLDALPIRLLSFTARKNGEDAALHWQIATEDNVNRYEVEVAMGDKDLQHGHFVKLGKVMSLGNTNDLRDYNYVDTTAGKTGTWYYRLKIIDNDLAVQYSAIRPVTFTRMYTSFVYPNPSSGLFYLSFQARSGEDINVSVYNTQGRLVQQEDSKGNGFVQKKKIDLRDANFANGVYLVQFQMDGAVQSFRVYKR